MLKCNNWKVTVKDCGSFFLCETSYLGHYWWVSSKQMKLLIRYQKSNITLKKYVKIAVRLKQNHNNWRLFNTTFRSTWYLPQYHTNSYVVTEVQIRRGYVKTYECKGHIIVCFHVINVTTGIIGLCQGNILQSNACILSLASWWN